MLNLTSPCGPCLQYCSASRKRTLLVVPKFAAKTRFKHSIQLLLDLSECKMGQIKCDEGFSSDRLNPRESIHSVNGGNQGQTLTAVGSNLHLVPSTYLTCRSSSSSISRLCSSWHFSSSAIIWASSCLSRSSKIWRDISSFTCAVLFKRIVRTGVDLFSR